MIEISKTKANQHYLVIDGVAFTKRQVLVTETRRGLINIRVLEEEARRAILPQRISDLPPDNHLLRIRNLPPSFLAGEITMEMAISKKLSSEIENVFWTIRFKPDEWKHLWSISEYREALIQAANSQGISTEVSEPVRATGISPEIVFIFPAPDVNSTIEAALLKIEREITELHASAEVSLAAKLRSESVVMYFDFPEEVRVPCEQYLLYFAQFLKDLGVEATAELTHEAGQVLFAVTPDNKHEALDKIQAALEAYLNLPASNLSGGEDDIVIQRLTSNVYHLKGQLALAKAVVQSQQATIQAQQVTIDRQRALDGEIIIGSLKQVIPQPVAEDKEEVLGGAVAITKYKGKGFEVNLPEMFRWLKRLFKDE